MSLNISRIRFGNWEGKFNEKNANVMNFMSISSRLGEGSFEYSLWAENELFMRMKLMFQEHHCTILKVLPQWHHSVGQGKTAINIQDIKIFSEINFTNLGRRGLFLAVQNGKI